MTQQLRDLMHRVADDAPPVSVDDDTWARARRSRRRELVAVPALALALLLGVVTVGLQPDWLPGRGREAQPAARAGLAGVGAVPDHVYAVPEGLEGRTPSGAWSHPREDVSVVGRASAGYLTSAGGAVLVSATDGVHHRVALPGFDDRFAGTVGEGPVLAVSPDGRQVAYAWTRPMRSDGTRVTSGVAAVDVGSGGGWVRRLPGGLGVRVSAIGWSPDGGYLVYRVGVLDRVDAGGGFSTGDYRLERLDVGTGRRTVLPRKIAELSGAPAVSNDGAVAVAAGTTLLTWAERAAPQVREESLPFDLSGASAWSADSKGVALGSTAPVEGVTVAWPGDDTTGSQGGVTRQVIQVLGWAGPHYVVAVRHPMSWDEATLDLLPVDVGTERTVGVVEGGVDLQSFTVATGLMSLQRPTVEFEPPAWARGMTWWWLGGGVLVLVAGAAALVVVRRRRA